MPTSPTKTQFCHCFHSLCNYLIPDFLWASQYLLFFTRQFISKREETITVDSFSKSWNEKNGGSIQAEQESDLLNFHWMYRQFLLPQM